MEQQISTKQVVLSAIQKLPDDATLEEILDGILLRLKVERGRAQIAAGEGISHEEVERRLARWLG
jgi:hypothetical protein